MSKPIFVRNHSYENMFLSCQSNSFSHERFCKRTRFETEAQGNSRSIISDAVLIRFSGQATTKSAY